VAAAEERYLDECADRIAKELGLTDKSPQQNQEQSDDQEDDLN
jgi:ribosome assembly protein YihI (activator of Der GTPase)